MIPETKKTIVPAFVGMMLILLTACSMKAKFEKEEKNQIQNFILNNSNLNYQLKPSGLYYLETETGAGPSPVPGDTVKINWSAMFLTGIVFATNTQDTIPFGFRVGEGPLQGLDEGVQYMKEGGKAMLLLPSKLAYGSSGNYYMGIPGFTPVIFEVKLLKVMAASVKK